ncbi:MAG: hypothetical protein ACOCXJ_07570, partial [Planctomycetota bacterium]
MARVNRRIRRLVIIAACAAVTSLPALEFGEESQEYRQELKELEEMEQLGPTGAVRDISAYQLDLKVDDLERIVIQDRLGGTRVYHYLPFRIRNRVSDTLEDIDYSSRYNEVVAQIAREYQGVAVDDNALVVDTGTEDDRLNTVIDRNELAAHTREVQLTVTAHDENDTRLSTLDDVHQGSQGRFNFDDEGERDVAIGFDEVRKRIEERLRRRLWLPSEISRKQIPPYDPDVKNQEGVAEGELHGVAIFDRLDPEGDQWTIEFRGLSNRIRGEVPVHSRDEVSDYINTRVLRRMYTTTFRRFGDEYSRDLDPWTRVREGWQWDNTFQRLGRRKQAALATYFLDNIADAQNQPRPDVLDEFRD